MFYHPKSMLLYFIQLRYFHVVSFEQLRCIIMHKAFKYNNLHWIFNKQNLFQNWASLLINWGFPVNSTQNIIIKTVLTYMHVLLFKALLPTVTFFICDFQISPDQSNHRGVNAHPTSTFGSGSGYLR